MDASSDSPVLAPAPLVPMTFGQILDRTYRLMRKHARLLLGIAAVPTVVLLFITVAALGCFFAAFSPQMTGNSAAPPVFPPWLGMIFICFYPIVIPIYALYLPAAAYAATQSNRGIVVTLRQAYEVAWSRFGRSLWLMILGMLYVVVPVMVIATLIGVAAVLMSHGAGTGSAPAYAFFLIPLLVLLYLGIFIYSILILLRFAVAYPACVEENLTAWKALQRSASLTRGAKGRIFLVLLVVYAIVYAIELGCILVLLIVAALGAVIAVSAHVAVGSTAFFILVGLGVIAYLIVIGICILISYAGFTTALAVIYHDQRLREQMLAPPPALA